MLEVCFLTHYEYTNVIQSSIPATTKRNCEICVWSILTSWLTGWLTSWLTSWLTNQEQKKVAVLSLDMQEVPFPTHYAQTDVIQSSIPAATTRICELFVWSI